MKRCFLSRARSPVQARVVLGACLLVSRARISALTLVQPFCSHSAMPFLPKPLLRVTSSVFLTLSLWPVLPICLYHFFLLSGTPHILACFPSTRGELRLGSHAHGDALTRPRYTLISNGPPATTCTMVQPHRPCCQAARPVCLPPRGPNLFISEPLARQPGRSPSTEDTTCCTRAKASSGGGQGQPYPTHDPPSSF